MGVIQEIFQIVKDHYKALVPMALAFFLAGWICGDRVGAALRLHAHQTIHQIYISNPWGQ